MADVKYTALEIESPLSGTVYLEHFRGEEAISTLYEFQATILAEKESLKPEDLVGEFVSCNIIAHKTDTRYFNGYVSRVGQGEIAHGGKQRRYHLTIVPWFWFLTQTSNCKIFQEKKVNEIVEDIFKTYGFQDYKVELKKTYVKRPFVVQYNESAYNFVSRLLEEEGIFYFFTFEQGKHTMVISDDPSAFKPCSGPDVHYRPDANIIGNISHWRHEYRFVTGGFAHTDYDHNAATVKLLASKKSKANFRNANALEKFEYPGRYADKGRGDQLAERRMEADEALLNTAYGDGGCLPFSVGLTFAFDKETAPPGAEDRFVLTSVLHTAQADVSGGNAGANVVYTNSFSCALSSVPYRPQRVTPKPRAIGPQTAVVVGASGDEIHTDEFGRVKVQFPWDREGNNDNNSGIFIRVVQSSAGPGYGAMMLPRVGWEVLVEFEAGDPDRPVVIGAVYNSQNKPPFKPSSNKGFTGFESRSTPGGSKETANILRFEDAKDQERLFIHCQKDMVTEVENDVQTDIGNNRAETIGKDETVTIGANRTESVDGNEDVAIKGNQTEAIDGNKSLTVGGDETIKIDGSLKLSAGSSITMEAGSSIELVVGGSTVKITPSDIQVAATKIKAQAQATMDLKAAKVGVAADAAAEVKGATVKVNGSALTDIGGGGVVKQQAGIIKIN